MPDNFLMPSLLALDIFLFVMNLFLSTLSQLHFWVDLSSLGWNVWENLLDV